MLPFLPLLDYDTLNIDAVACSTVDGLSSGRRSFSFIITSTALTLSTDEKYYILLFPFGARYVALTAWLNCHPLLLRHLYKMADVLLDSHPICVTLYISHYRYIYKKHSITCIRPTQHSSCGLRKLLHSLYMARVHHVMIRSFYSTPVHHLVLHSPYSARVQHSVLSSLRNARIHYTVIFHCTVLVFISFANNWLTRNLLLIKNFGWWDYWLYVASQHAFTPVRHHISHHSSVFWRSCWD